MHFRGKTDEAPSLHFCGAAHWASTTGYNFWSTLSTPNRPTIEHNQHNPCAPHSWKKWEIGAELSSSLVLRWQSHPSTWRIEVPQLDIIVHATRQHLRP